MERVTLSARRHVPPRPLPIKTPFITLGELLKFAGVCDTGSEARRCIAEGEVWVDGELCDKRGKKLYPGAVVRVRGASFRVSADA